MTHSSENGLQHIPTADGGTIEILLLPPQAGWTLIYQGALRPLRSCSGRWRPPRPRGGCAWSSTLDPAMEVPRAGLAGESPMPRKTLLSSTLLSSWTLLVWSAV